MNFLDEATIHVAAGDGGNGCIAFRREKFVPRGGPSGGDGGNGGSVDLIGTNRMNTLYHLRHKPHLKADRGRHGEGSNRTGKSGELRQIEVPLGTVAFDAESGDRLGEVLEEGDTLRVAAGGLGGRGNQHFATPTRRAPRYAEEGRPGEERKIRLELKLLADVGLVGLPNAGKSTLISAISAARPKIADYPFTTLVPQLGVVAKGAIDKTFVVADLPGLISGAAEGAGLGHRFLRHVERCRVMLHLVDLSGGEAAYMDPEAPELQNPVAATLDELLAIEAELEAFEPELLRRERVLVGSKADAALPERSEALQAAAAERGLRYFEISSATRAGLEALVAHVAERLSVLDRVPEPPPAPRPWFESEAPDATEASEGAVERSRTLEAPDESVPGGGGS